VSVLFAAEEIFHQGILSPLCLYFFLELSQEICIVLGISEILESIGCPISVKVFENAIV
jgi:hypothetical protein